MCVSLHLVVWFKFFCIGFKAVKCCYRLWWEALKLWGLWGWPRWLILILGSISFSNEADHVVPLGYPRLVGKPVHCVTDSREIVRHRMLCCVLERWQMLFLSRYPVSPNWMSLNPSLNIRSHCVLFILCYRCSHELFRSKVGIHRCFLRLRWSAFHCQIKLF